MISQQTIDSILKSGFQGVFAITGGGSEAIAALLRNGGGSAVFLDGRTPWATKAFTKFTGKTPAQFCSSEAADLLAISALNEAKDLVSEDQDPLRLFGLGVTAVLAKNGAERPDRKHRAFFSIFLSNGKSYRGETTIIKASRIEEENTVVETVLTQLAAALKHD